MNIHELINTGANVAITITPNDLKEFALCIINETMSAKTQEEQERYLTPDETASLIGVSKNTLWRWEKEQYLVPIKVGRKSRYRLSNVNALLGNQSVANNPVAGK